MATQLFVDGSCDPRSKIGYGAMLRVDGADERRPADCESSVVVHRFHPCSSSSLELMTLLWALARLGTDARGLVVHTDSQTIEGLAERRAALEATGFCSRRGRPLSQAALYRDFYDAFDRLSFELVKLKGHRPKSEKSREERLFTLVDRASRSALRAELML